MKRVWLWLTVGFVLFSVSGGFAKEEVLPADLANLPPDTIFYDNYHKVNNPAGQSLIGPSDYWVGVRFTVPIDKFGFTIGGVEFKVNNELLNTDDAAYLYLVRDTSYVSGSYQPNLLNGIIESVAVVAPFNRLQGKEFLSSLSSREFGFAASFWIVLGSVPGGPDTDSAGQGWWAFSDNDTNRNTSYASFGDRDSWELRPAAAGNFVIRARGDFSPPPDVVINEVMFNADPSSPDSTRNHEWVELYNKENIQTISSQWRLYNEANRPETLLSTDFPGGSYLVVHFGAPGHAIPEIVPGSNRKDMYLPLNGEYFSNRQGGCALVVGSSALSIASWNLKNLSNESVLDSASVPGMKDWESSFLGTKHLPLEFFRVGRLQPKGGIGPLLTTTPGISIGRDSLSSDSAFSIASSLGPQWKGLTFMGGPNSAGSTMGRKNAFPMEFNTTVSDIIQQTSSWMVMLYMVGDYGDSLRSPDRWYFDVLNQIERVLPPAPRDVNVAVLYDTRRGRTEGGGISQAAGATFRGTMKRDSLDQVHNLTLITPSLNTGATATLSGFIKWAKDSLPSADHYVLALKGDGAGWEGLCGDEGGDGVGDNDRQEMGELKSALQTGLGGGTLDLLILDAPLMGQLEVANQMQGLADFMVASPEMTSPGDFDYARLIIKLLAEGTISSENLAKFAVDSILKSRLGGIANNLFTDPSAVWAAYRLDNLPALRSFVDLLAQNLKNGIEDRCQPRNSDDNFQLKLRGQLKGTDQYGRQAQGMADFVDLKHLAVQLKGINLTGCPLANVLGASDIDTILQEGHSIVVSLFKNSALRPSAGGLSIYFPSSRQHWPPISVTQKNLTYKSESDHPFDSTGLFLGGGAFETQYIYASDSGACYPNLSGGCDTLTSNDSARNYPYPPTPNFAFADNTHWDDFLIRYYKPVADVESTFLSKTVLQSFLLNGTGTSDPDSDSLIYFWDLDIREDSDDPCNSFELEDVDKNCYDDSTDDGDVKGGQTTTFSGFLTAGHHTLWLNVWDDYHLFSSSPRFQTSRSKDTVVVQIEFKKVKIAYEDLSVDQYYFDTKDSLLPRVGDDPVDLTVPSSRDAIVPNRLTIEYDPSPHILWSTGNQTTHTFPPACQTALNNAMVNDGQGAWVCGPRLGADVDTAVLYFKNNWGFTVDSTKTAANFLVPYAGLQHFLRDLDTLPLNLGTPLERLTNVNCPTFPILTDSSGNIVAAARVIADSQRAIIFSTVGLEHIAGFSRGKDLLTRVLSWLIRPVRPPDLPVCCVKGDFNGIGGYTSADAVAMLNCVYSGTGNCDYCFADVNCDNELTSADAVLELNRVFLELKDPPWCGL